MNREQHGELAYWYWGVKGWYPKEVLRLITLKAKRQTFLTSKFLGCHSIGHVSHLDIIFFFCMIELLCGFLTCFDMTNTLLYFFWLILATLPWINMYKKKNGFHSQYLVNTMKRNVLIKMIYDFFLPPLLMNFTFFTPLFPYTPLIPEIWLLILPLKITYKNLLVLDHDDNFYLISLSILSTCLLNSVWILSEVNCYHFWELKD